MSKVLSGDKIIPSSYTAIAAALIECLERKGPVKNAPAAFDAFRRFLGYVLAGIDQQAGRPRPDDVTLAQAMSGLTLGLEITAASHKESDYHANYLELFCRRWIKFIEVGRNSDDGLLPSSKKDNETMLAFLTELQRRGDEEAETELHLGNNG